MDFTENQKQKLNELHNLTDTNNHSEWVICASQLLSHAERLIGEQDISAVAAAILTIHKYELSLSNDLLNAREKLVRTILYRISQSYGSDFAAAVKATR